MKKSKFQKIVREAVREELKETLKPMLAEIINEMIKGLENTKKSTVKKEQKYKKKFKNEQERKQFRDKLKKSIKPAEYNVKFSSDNNINKIMQETAKEMVGEEDPEDVAAVNITGDEYTKSVLESKAIKPALPENVSKYLDPDRNKELLKEMENE